MVRSLGAKTDAGSIREPKPAALSLFGGNPEIFVILGDAAIAAEPRESSLDDPAAWQDDKTFQVVTALDDFEAQHRNFGNGGFDLPRVVAIVRPDQFEPGEAVADFIEDKPCAIAILDAGGMNDGPQRQAFGVDKGVNLSPLDL